MAHLIRPLRHCPRLQRSSYTLTTLNPLLSTPPLTNLISNRPSSLPITTSVHRNVRHRPRGGLRLPNNAPSPSDVQNTDGSDLNVKKSRNQLKREAQRAVKWAMDLASFSNPQIKRILKAVSLEDDVFDAVVIVKRLGPDVREGKRRQFNYIGKLLREVQSELMDGLIQATKDGDHSMFRALSDSSSLEIVDDDVDEEIEEVEYASEEEESSGYIEIASRWVDGLISKDIQITNEVYSLHSVDFDRQELRKLVRNVHAIQDQQVADGAGEGGIDVAVNKAKKSLTRFLRTLAEQYTKGCKRFVFAADLTNELFSSSVMTTKFKGWRTPEKRRQKTFVDSRRLLSRFFC